MTGGTKGRVLESISLCSKCRSRKAVVGWGVRSR